MTTDTQQKILVQALRDIIDPIGKFRRELKSDERLDGQGAAMLSNSASYLKSLAKDALKQVGLSEKTASKKEVR